MTKSTTKLDADAWARRLGQRFDIDAADALSDFLALPVVALDAHLTPDRIYDPRLLTFRGGFVARVMRTCVMTLDDFEETVTGDFERSFRLSSTAPSVPEGAEEADDFPENGVALIDLLGDEIALQLSNFPRAPGAQLLEVSVEDVGEGEARPNPFAALAELKQRL